MLPELALIGSRAVASNQITCEGARAFVLKACLLLFKGGDPAARSRTATLLRLHPSHKPHRGKRPPEG
jgi:hypothetical protein